ncbi:MAG: carbohydrate ABC transporter permease [Oscillospiraceae bacterium]|nr:carbohydrate ABC transporter permease [Oscillospiraceae bacterium]
MSGFVKSSERKLSTQKFGGLQSKRRTNTVFNIISFILIVSIAAVVLLPIWWIFRSSVMGSQGIFLWPPTFFPLGTLNVTEWLWSNYIINPASFNFWLNLRNSLTITVPCVIFGTATAISCAYAFARLRFRGKKFLFSLCVGSMLMPAAVTLVPLYMAWSALGLVPSYWPLILPYLCGGGAFNIFLLRQFIRTVPRELDEAAKIDGAGYFRTLVSIIVPSIKSAIIVVALLIFITTWNDLLQQMIYIHSRESYTMVLGLTSFFGTFRTDFAGMFAATVMTILPPLVIYIFGQRYFVEGIVMTGMKN